MLFLENEAQINKNNYAMILFMLAVVIMVNDYTTHWWAD